MAHHTDSVVVFRTAVQKYEVAVGAAGMAVRNPGMPNGKENWIVGVWGLCIECAGEGATKFPVKVW